MFRDDADRQYFASRLIFYRERFDVTILAHCLMTTHFHLAPRTGEYSLSDFMQSLLTSYTRYFNDRWLVRGHLFQGRFGSRACSGDNDVRGVIRYIHSNPVEAGIAVIPGDWPWSSHRGYLSGNDDVVNVQEALSFFGDLQGYLNFMAQSPKRTERPDLVALAYIVCGEGGIALIRSPSKTTEASGLRREFIVLALQYSYRRSEIAKFLNRSPSSITMLLGHGKN